MQPINMLQAKSTLSRLVEAIEQGHEREIVIARNGRPVAKLVPVDAVPVGQRIGVAKGLFEVPDSIDAHNEEVATPVLEAGGLQAVAAADTHTAFTMAWNPRSLRAEYAPTAHPSESDRAI